MKTFLLQVSSNQLSPYMAASVVERVIGVDSYDSVAQNLIPKLESMMDMAREKRDATIPDLTPHESLLLYLWAKLGAGTINAREVDLNSPDSPESPSSEDNSSR